MSGKYDIVYMVKDSSPNEELRHSLRSVEKNWGPRGKVWFFGGCPEGLKPDGFVPAEMTMPGKWENTHRLMRLICDRLFKLRFERQRDHATSRGHIQKRLFCLRGATHTC